MSPELIIVLVDFFLVLFAYLWFYPRVVQDDIAKLAKYDLLVSLMAVLIAGVLFYEKDIVFTFFHWQLDWFWYSIIWYFILEIPYALIYMKKFDMWK